MPIPGFLEAIRQKMEARGIPFAVLPIAVIVIIAGLVYFFFLWPPAVTAFKITVLSAGEPLAGAVVEVYDERGNLVDTAVSDENGLASFKALPAKRLKFKAVKTGLEPVERSIDLAKTVSAQVELAAPTPAPTPVPPPVVLLPSPSPEHAETTHAITFNSDEPPKGKLSVIVRDKAGKPVNATVKLFNSD